MSTSDLYADFGKRAYQLCVGGDQVCVFIVCTYGRKARLMRGAEKEAGRYSEAARTLISI